VLGTTGEASVLTREEQQLVLEQTVQQVAGKIPVIAGAGCNNTANTVERVQRYRALGADAALVVTPYYSKPTQAGLLAHYTAVAQASDMPIIVYNVPGRTGCDCAVETVQELEQLPTIVAIKEASGDLDRIKALLQKTSLSVLSGDDESACEALLAGAHGVISVTANVVPEVMHALCKAALARQCEAAQDTNEKIAALHEVLFCESNPIPVKWALHRMGKIPSGIRLPLTACSPAGQQQVQVVLEGLNLLEK
jgi:4-hydroxy-tetrahydrodipicolinate synthase